MEYVIRNSKVIDLFKNYLDNHNIKYRFELGCCMIATFTLLDELDYWKVKFAYEEICYGIYR